MKIIISYLMVCISLSLAQEEQRIVFPEQTLNRMQTLLNIDPEPDEYTPDDKELAQILLLAFNFLKSELARSDIAIIANAGTDTIAQKVWDTIYPHCDKPAESPETLTLTIIHAALTMLEEHINEAPVEPPSRKRTRLR